MNAYVASLLMFGAIYAILGLGLNLQWGHTGLVNLGFVAFFAIGAYASALMTLGGLPPILGPVIGLIVAGLAAYPVGRVSLNLSDDYLAIVSFAFAEAIRVLFMNVDWSGGTSGLTGIPPIFGGVDTAARPYVQLAFAGAIAVLLVLMSNRVTRSPYGRLLRAIRDNADAVASLGKNPMGYRMAALMLGSAMAGLAGGIYGQYIGYISPQQFDSTLSFMVFTGIVIGGSSHWGAALGTVLFIGVIEATRFLPGLDLFVTAAQLAQIRLIVVGLVLITFMQFRPQGLWPYRYHHRQLRAELDEQTGVTHAAD